MIALLLIGMGCLLTAHAQGLRDGRLFDQGLSMTERSPRASETLDVMKPLLGAWNVEVTMYAADGTAHAATGVADVHYMNRGYAYQERRRVPTYDAEGHALDALSFLVYSPSTERWSLGEANAYTEHIEVYDGTVSADGPLVLQTVVRRRGGPRLIHEHVSYDLDAPDAFTVTVSRSVDGRPSRTVERRQYTRRSTDGPALATRDDWGEPAPNRIEQARQFDFLIGTWDAAHRINMNGNWIAYPATATASYVLDGRGILEYSWFDTDPNLPNAGTSIVRLYNRAERRWESLYLANRGNALLDFGGGKEGDWMILHLFDTNRTDPISRFVFHTIEPDSYQWFAETSIDRGQTFNSTWTIAYSRKK